VYAAPARHEMHHYGEKRSRRNVSVHRTHKPIGNHGKGGENTSLTWAKKEEYVRAQDDRKPANRNLDLFTCFISTA